MPEEFVVLDDDSPNLPPYNKKGDAIIDVLGRCSTGVYRFEIEIVDYDPDSAIYWIDEFEGWDFWVDENCDFPGPGRYLIKGIRGQYHFGEFWSGIDDDVQWQHDSIEQTDACSLLPAGCAEDET